MKQLNKTKLAITSLGVAILLSGCGKVLDFRNSEISNNKIYSNGENSPFTGKITNIPLNKIPAGKIGQIIKILSTVTKDKSYSELLLVNSLAGMMGKGDGGIVCDAPVDQGVLDGDVICKLASKEIPLFRIPYKKGGIDGKLIIYDLNKKENILTEASFSNGDLDGASTIYSPKTGKTIHRAAWKNGKANGLEEMFDESTGNLIFKGNIVNGQFDGEAVEYSNDGKLIKKTMWKDGVIQQDAIQSPTTNNANPKNCVDLWGDAYRREHGDDAMVTADQVGEWETWCKEGKNPNSASQGAQTTPAQVVAAPMAPAAPAPAADNSPFAPSFDCVKVSTGLERLICSDRELSKLDVELNSAYSNAREKSLDKKKLKSEQIGWVKTSRNACSERSCMVTAYQQRIEELSK